MAKIGAFLTNAKNRYTNTNIENNVSDLVHRIYIFHKPTKIFFYFPINPQVMRVEQNSDLYSNNVIGLGDIVKSRIPKLRKWSWEGLFMRDVFDPLNVMGSILPPGSYVKMLQQIQAEGSPFNFAYISMNAAIQFIKQTNTYALIENFNWEERGGEPGDVYYNISITEYRTMKIETASLSATDDTKNKNLAENLQKLREVIV